MIPILAGTEIPVDRFIYYTDYYALSARSGISSAQSLFTGIAPVAVVDTNTFDRHDEAFNAVNEFLLELQSSYEQVYVNARSLHPMRQSFVALSAHILHFTSQTIDAYLTAQGRKVKATYASISTFMGDTISAGNIVED